MRIGQLAERTGVDAQTIRFYEKKGLLSPPGRRENGYRTYTERHCEELAFIRRCRILGLSLAEIRELRSYRDDPHRPCATVNALLDAHIAEVRSQMAALAALERELVALRGRCNGGKAGACGVLAGIGEGPRK